MANTSIYKMGDEVAQKPCNQESVSQKLEIGMSPLGRSRPEGELNHLLVGDYEDGQKQEFKRLTISAVQWHSASVEPQEIGLPGLLTEFILIK